MSRETELKFQIPPAALAAVRRAVATAGACVQALDASYLDTPDDRLAQARIALRLRREGGQWVQTLKAAGSHALHRLEHNVAIPGTQVPVLDLARHHGSAAAQALQAVLSPAQAGLLTERYRTEIQRTLRPLRCQGAVVELALDEGAIVAGPHRLAVCELEMELLQGPPQAMLALASRWVDRFGLVLDTRSKSARGHALANLGRPAGTQGAAAPAGAQRHPRRRTTGAKLAPTPAPALAWRVGQVLDLVAPALDGPLDRDQAAALASALSVLGEPLRSLQAGGDQALAPRLSALRQQWRRARAADVARAAAVAAAPPHEAKAGQASQRMAEETALWRAPATQQLWLGLLAIGLGGEPGSAA